MIAEDEDLEPDRTSTVRNYTFDEVVAGLSALGELDVARLDGISRGLARTADMEPKDLLHEAVYRMVTKRTCPVDVDIVGFAIQTMKSIASTSYRRRRQNLDEGVTSIPIAANDGGFDVADDAVSPEEQALARIFHGKCLALVDATVADDEGCSSWSWAFVTDFWVGSSRSSWKRIRRGWRLRVDAWRTAFAGLSQRVRPYEQGT
ncbi:hypothetical protein ACWGNZ_06410 [Sphingomonas zeae]